MIINLPKIGDVEFPDNLTPQQYDALVQRLGDKYGFRPPKPEVGLGALLKRGAMRSLGEAGIALGDVLPAVVGSALGAKQFAERQMEEARVSRERLEEKYPTQFKSFEEAETPYEKLQYATETIGEIVPTAATAIIPGVGLGAAGSRLAGAAALRAATVGGAERAALAAPVVRAAAEKGAQRGMYGGVFLGSYALNTPEVFEGIYRETGKMEPGIAALAGGISAVLDSALPGMVLNKLGPYGQLKVVEKLAKDSNAAPKVWKSIGKEAAKLAPAEGLTETAQEAIGAYAEQVAGSAKGLTDPENIQRYKEAFIKGAIGGAAFGVPGGVADYMRAKAQQKAEAAPPPEAAAAPEAAPAAPETLALPAPEARLMLPAPGKKAPTAEDIAVMEERMANLRPGSEAYSEIEQAIAQARKAQEKVDAAKAAKSAFATAEPTEEGLYRPSTVVDVPTLKSLGMTPTSKTSQQLVGTDLSTPEGVKKFIQTIEDPGFKGKIDEAAYEQFVATFDPQVVEAARAELKAAPAAKETKDVGQAVKPPSGGGVGVAGVPPTGAATEGVAGVEPTGVVSTESDVGQPPAREAGAPSTVTTGEAVSEPLATTPPSEATTKVVSPPAAPTRAARVQEPRADTTAETVTAEEPPAPPTADQTDKQIIQERLGKKQLTPLERDARAYFGKIELSKAIRSIANDLVYQPTAYKQSKKKLPSATEKGKFAVEPEPMFGTEAEAAFFRGQGGIHARNAADWVRSNLSPKNVEYMDRWVKQYEKEARSSAKARSKLAKQTQREKIEKEVFAKEAKEREISTLAKALERGDDYYDDMTDDDYRGIINTGKDRWDASPEAAALHDPAHPVTLDMLEQGRLVDALETMGDSASSAFARQIADTLSKYVGNVKLVYGAERSQFDPKTNTIYLRDNATEYEILHESAHAALSHVLDKPSHPVTAQLRKIFDQVKNDINGAYGAKNLQEFAAEVWSNDEFRTRLKEMRTESPNLSMWDKLMGVLRRFFGFPARQTSALDAVDRMLNEIVSQPPEVREGDTLYAQSINTPNVAQKIFNGMDNYMQKLPGMTPDRATELWGKVETLGVSGRQAVYKFLNLSAMGQLGSRFFKETSIQFADTVNEMAGYYENLMERMQPLNQLLQKFAATGRYQEWSTLVHDSTIEDVNPAVKRDNYVGSPEKLAAYDKLRGRYMKLTAEEQRLYNDLFGSYKSLFKELRDSIRQNLLETIPDQAKALNAYNKIMNEIIATGIDHYAPLFRTGTYWLAYTDANNQRVKKLFPTQAARAAARRELQGQNATDIEEYSRIEEMTSRRVPVGTVAAEIVKIMKEGGADERAVDKFLQMIVASLPETSVLKRFQRRKNTPGYVDDAAMAYANVTSSTARQLSRMRYKEKLNNQMSEMIEQANKLRGQDNVLAGEMVQELQGRLNFAMDPNIASWAQYASSAAFYFNLAGNVSSAAMNSLQTPMVTLPQLGGTYGYMKAGKALNNALKLYASSGLTRRIKDINDQMVEEKAMLSVENLVTTGKAPEYTALVKRLKELGFLQTSTVRDAVQIAKRESGREPSLAEKVMAYSAFLFHHTERMNREVTAVAAYNLEMDRLKNVRNMAEADKQAQAIDKAIRMVEYTHGAGHTESGPSIGHNEIGKVLTVFKRFGFTMYYMLFDTIFRSFPLKGVKTEEERLARSAARRQLAGVYGMAGLFAGVKGIPLYWIAEAVYNALNDDDEDDFDAMMRKFLGEFLFKGPVNYITNLGVADRVGWTDLIYREQKGDKVDASALSQIVENIMGAPYAIVNNMFRAHELISDGHYYRGIEMMLPVALRNVMKGMRYATEGANTLRGDPVMAEINGYNAAMQVLGFAPADLLRQYEENAYLKQKEKAISGEEKKLLKKYYVALRSEDYDRADKLADKLFDLGDKYPELGISQDTLNRSVRSRDKISQDMYHGVQLNKKLYPRFMEDVEALG